jgi:hypothetical protein
MKKFEIIFFLIFTVLFLLSCTSNEYEIFAKKLIKNPEKYKEIVDSSKYIHKYYLTVKKGDSDRDLIDVNEDIRNIKYFNSETFFYTTSSQLYESSNIENCNGLNCRKLSLVLSSKGYNLEFIWYKTSDSTVHYYGTKLKDTRALQKAMENAIQQMYKK